MKGLLIASGIVVFVAGVVLAIVFTIEVKQLSQILEHNTQLSGFEKITIQSGITRLKLYSPGVVLSGLVASVPYFALAAILRRTENLPE